ncbi:MAG: ABC transporter substrate-binding protein [Rhizobacter sp.]
MKPIFKRLNQLLIGAVLASSALWANAQELRIGLSSNPQSADPHFFNNDAVSGLLAHSYEPLIALDGKNKLAPALAKSWRAVNDNTWEFKLRENVKFHDGSPFTAEDVVFSLDRPATIVNSPSSFTQFTRGIVTKKIIDPLTILLVTSAPAPLLPNDLTRIFIVSKKAAEKATTEDFNLSKVEAGTGPFKLVKFTRGEGTQLARFDGYWGSKPAWATVNVRFLPTDSARTAALLSGDVQLIEGIQPNLVTQFKANKDFTVVEKVSTRVLFLFTDHRDSSPYVTDKEGKPLDKNPLKDARVRTAISKLIDRNVLTDRVLDKLGVPTGNIATPGAFGFNPNLKPEPLDVEGAKKLLTEAGYPNGFGLTIFGPNDRYINDEQVIQAIGQFLTRGGITTKVVATPNSTFIGRASKKELGVGLLGWGVGGGEPSSPLRGLLATTNPEKGLGGSNWSSYSSPEYDKLIAEALSTVDDKKREKLFQDAAELALKKDQAIIPLYNQIATWGVRKGYSYAPSVGEYTLAQDVKPK